MKTTYHTPLKTNWKTPFAFCKMPKQGVQRPVSRLAASQSPYKPAGITPRVACVKRAKDGYKIVGLLEIVKGNFEAAKNFLRENNFTAAKMGAVYAVL